MAKVHGSNIAIISLGSNDNLAKEIAKGLGVKLLDVSIACFADGEVNIDVKETVRGHNVFVVQSTSFPVDENYMKLFIMIDALKRASAKTINIIMPYYGYSRQDRKAGPRQPISAKLMADLLTTAGATRVLAMDLHAAQIQGFFDIPIDGLEATPIFVNYILKKKFKDIVIVSPDHGGAKRASKYADYLGNAPLAIIDKRRPKPNVVEINALIGDVKDKTAIIVDDMVDTAGSLMAAIDTLLKAGAKEVYMLATHGILSGSAIERIQNSKLKKLIITNTIEQPIEKQIDKIEVLSVAKIFTYAILNIIDNKSLSYLFGYSEDSDFND
ncbi:MAG TPA: ribose-phosphate pyrophosphokinase [Candidatus Onthovivens sp.]|nr:ribose-phosphate pyrophosphokinase [Candidatus Onthovivens sp.]